MRAWFKLWATPRIAADACKTALFVGTMLNVLNQGDAWMEGSAIDWWRTGLNYLVPYLVSSHSAARNERARDRASSRSIGSR